MQNMFCLEVRGLVEKKKGLGAGERNDPNNMHM
jgi:hypothetical protein